MELKVYEIKKMKTKGKFLIWLLDTTTGQLFTLPMIVRD